MTAPFISRTSNVRAHGTKVRIALTFLAGLAAAGPTLATAHAQVAIVGNLVEEKLGQPGERYAGKLVIANPTAEEQSVRVYQTDYTFAADGTSQFDAAGTLPRSNAKWITVGAERVVIPAGATATVQYSVAVPLSDSLAGTYWSAIMVEGTPTAAVRGQARREVGIGTVIRYAVQVATHVGDGGDRRVSISNPAVDTATTGSALGVDIRNSGNRAYRPSLTMELYDANGVLRHRAAATRGLLYPGSSLHQHFDLGPLQKGRYKVVIFADSGDDSVFGAQYTIAF